MVGDLDGLFARMGVVVMGGVVVVMAMGVFGHSWGVSGWKAVNVDLMMDALMPMHHGGEEIVWKFVLSIRVCSSHADIASGRKLHFGKQS